MATKVIYSKEVTENKFMDITLPEFSMFNVHLSESASVTKEKKSGLEVARTYDFNLRIDATKVAEAQIQELSDNLKSLFGLNWAPYDYKTKTYKFFTTRFQPESVKQSQLTQIFEYLHEFELQYPAKIAHSLEVFNADAVSKVSYKDYELAVKFHEPSGKFVVLALAYLGGDRYTILSKASSEKGLLSTAPLEPGFFDDLVKIGKRDPYYFMITPESYVNVKNLVEKIESAKIEFQSQQKEIADQFDPD
jgi:hypothetical protein